MVAHTVFISDLHLTPERPEAVERFRRFLGETARKAQALHILGDFFEVWVGDDDLADPFNAGIAAELRRLAEAGTALFFQPGNRDFLLGNIFAEAAGLTLLPDPCVIDLYGTPSLISHGDAWCTDDLTYQAFRSQVRNPAWQAAVLSKPLDQRHALARAIREQSEVTKPGVKPEIMDVNAETIAAAFSTHGVKRIIHGHTHRPARHDHGVDDQDRERWVLPDWYETGGYLTCDAAGCRLVWLD